jgi:sialate O-acetylesterase
MKQLALLLTLVFTWILSIANITLPRIFGSNMVLQRNKTIPVWGWADAGERITVQFNKQVKKTRAAKDGSWKIELGQQSAGGPYQLIVKGKNEVILENVLVGEVWVCSGQSNMEWPVKNSDSAAREIRESTYPLIRHIKVPRTIADTPATNISAGDWVEASPSTTGDFTAVGYFFARKLFNELKVPIGLINTSWGGTMVEAWTSREAFEKSEDFKNLFGNVTFKEIKDVADKAGKPVSPNSYPTLLYNGMINPLIPFAIKGVIWYQGETNAGRAYQYRKAFPLMIEDWRKRFGQGNFPFYFVQLASFNASNGNSARGSGWAELREAQTSTLSLPNTGMVVTMDIGESKDIHPRNKQDVGARLAAIALNNEYGITAEYSGPMYESFKIDGNKALLNFKHVGNGLMAKDKYGYLKGFEIAGNDQKFFYAKAEIRNNQVVVYTDSVASPVAVRYGWADDMPEANLYNKDGFPASPFRTDSWKGVTEAVRYEIKK